MKSRLPLVYFTVLVCARSCPFLLFLGIRWNNVALLWKTGLCSLNLPSLWSCVIVLETGLQGISTFGKSCHGDRICALPLNSSPARDPFSPLHPWPGEAGQGHAYLGWMSLLEGNVWRVLNHTKWLMCVACWGHWWKGPGFRGEMWLATEDRACPLRCPQGGKMKTPRLLGLGPSFFSSSQLWS